MKVQELEKLVVKAQHDLLQAELKAADLQKQLQTARAKNRQAKRSYKNARRAARKVKQLAGAAAERATEQQRVFARARKRLAKAWKKIGLLKTLPKFRPTPRHKLLAARKGVSVPVRVAPSGNAAPPPNVPAPALPRRPGAVAFSAFSQVQPSSSL